MDHYAENTPELNKGEKDAIMILLKKLISGMFFMLFSMVTMAQEKNNVEMADLMRSNGRIYVVIAVMLLILIGLMLYLVRLDRKISKLERDNRQ